MIDNKKLKNIKDERVFVPIGSLVHFIGIEGSFLTEESLTGGCKGCFFLKKEKGYCVTKGLNKYCASQFRIDNKDLTFRSIREMYMIDLEDDKEND